MDYVTSFQNARLFWRRWWRHQMIPALSSKRPIWSRSRWLTKRFRQLFKAWNNRVIIPVIRRDDQSWTDVGSSFPAECLHRNQIPARNIRQHAELSCFPWLMFSRCVHSSARLFVIALTAAQHSTWRFSVPRSCLLTVRAELLPRLEQSSALHPRRSRRLQTDGTQII